MKNVKRFIDYLDIFFLLKYRNDAAIQMHVIDEMIKRSLSRNVKAFE